MTTTDLPRDAWIYGDSNFWIYHIEGVPMWRSTIDAFLVAAALANARFFASELAWAECIYKPARDNDTRAVQVFDAFFSQPAINVLPIEGRDIVDAGRWGGAIGLRLADAIHFRCALKAGCTHFVTSDRRFRTGPAMQVILLEAAGGPT